MTDFTCDECNKRVAVSNNELLLPEEYAARRLALAPKGWIIVDVCAYNEWTSKWLRPFGGHDDRSAHVCSSACAAQFLSAFARRCEQELGSTSNVTPAPAEVA